MNNFNLMRAAGFGVKFLGGRSQLFVAVAWSNPMQTDIFWCLVNNQAFAWRCADISPELFTQLPNASRDAVSVVIVKWEDGIYELDDWPCAPIAEMLQELEQTPEGSPLDRALDSIAHGAAAHFPTVAAELAAREAREIAAAIQQPQPAAGPKSGRL